MSSPLKPVCAMKQGKYQCTSWSQRLVTVDTESGAVWISKKHHQDHPYHHKLIGVDVQPWTVYKEKYVRVNPRSKEAMLSVVLKGYVVPTSQEEKSELQRQLHAGAAVAPPATTQVDVSSFTFGSSSTDVPAAATGAGTPSDSAAAAQPVLARRDTVHYALRFTSVDNLLDFTNAIAQAHLNRNDKAGAAQVVSDRDCAIVALEQLAAQEGHGNTIAELM